MPDTACIFEEGWYEESDGTVLIRLFSHERIELEVNAAESL